MNILYGLILVSFFFISTLQAQTCNSKIVKSTPISNFLDQGDGTVLDINTDLIWKECNEGQIWDNGICTESALKYSWLGSFHQAEKANINNYAGRNNWRVPNVKELSSIIEFSCYSPAINKNVFSFPLVSTIYWSSTSSGSFWDANKQFLKHEGAWSVNFTHGSLNVIKKNLTNYVRLVHSK